ncbi:MAG: ABC transporter permease [Defluviitaleaceae bacterium]|nr:ABC transporter permease [Defluviitaleaceae bacterium]
MERFRGKILPFILRLLRRSKGTFIFILGMVVVGIVWHFLALHIDRTIILPNFAETMRVFISLWTDEVVMTGLLITLERIFRGFGIAVLIGLPLGLLMGYSKTIRDALSPLMNSVRQVPVMAWIPLGVIWFGIMGGVTTFIITISSIFPLMLNTIAGVQNIDQNYINAAKSMGASQFKIFTTIILPGALPNFLVGCRLGLGLAWFSVICAEFIATREGFGFLIVNAQHGFQIYMLYSLIIMSGVVGFLLDRILQVIERLVTPWRYKNAAID